MKKSILFLGIAISMLACSGKSNNNSKFASAADYDNFITTRITKMQQSLFAVQNGSTDSVHVFDFIKKYESQIDSINKSIKNMPEFNGNSAYRNAAMNLGSFYKKSVGNYYVDIAKVYKETKDSTAETKVNEIISKLQEEERKTDDLFIKERQAFADKNNIVITTEEAK